ncbi:MAG TPA: hypothetical protein DDW52_30255 [Planctomycetaceae bacterium]|nr:hypothetical protein [Planctomycetaceae bacterium]
MKTERLILAVAVALVGCGSKESPGVATRGDSSGSISAEAKDSDPGTSDAGTLQREDNSDVAFKGGQEPPVAAQPTSQSQPVTSGAPANAGTIPLAPQVLLQVDNSWPRPPVDSGQLRQSAEQLADELVRRFPDNADAWEVKARIDVLLGQTDAAEAAWRRALKIDANYPYALHGMGKAELLHSNYESAIDYLVRARDAQPDVAEVVHDLSKAYTKSGQVEKAAEVLKAFTEQNADATEAFVLLGAAYQSLKQFGPAKEAYERALDLYPDLPRAQQGLGTVLVRLGDRERARELLAAQRAARSTESTNRSAEELFQDSCRDTSVRYAFAARVLINAGAVPLAIKTLKFAVVLDDENQDAWKLLLDILAANRMWSEAVQAATRLVESDSGNSSYWFTLGNYQVQGMQIGDARKSFRKVIELSPKDAAGYQALVQMNVQTRHDPAATIAFARELIEVRGAAADYELLGQAYAVAAKYEKAKSALQRAIELEPTNERYQQAMRQLQEFLSSR